MSDLLSLSNLIAVSGEIELTGTAVSRGVAVGSAVCLIGNKRQFFRVDVPRESIGFEVQRFELALNQSKEELGSLASGANHQIENAKGIFEVQLLILEQSEFAEKVRKAIADESVNAEWAVTTMAETLVNKIRAATDDTFKEKHLDIQDIAERILNALGTTVEHEWALSTDSIVVAASIRPSTLVELSRHKPLAIITEHGGWTSHAFIMARELGIPAVTGFKDLRNFVEAGDSILVDGFSGRVVIRPTDDTIAAAIHENRVNSAIPVESVEYLKPAVTIDGRQIVIRANVEQFHSASELRKLGSAGIGLLRSEYLFGQSIGSFPAEEEQISAYRTVAENIGGDRVRIRTFDLTSDQLSFNIADREANPSLGLRAIRLSFADESKFRTQIRALLCSHIKNNIEILLPMISGPEEIRRARILIEQEQVLLRGIGIDAGDPRVGAMIEIPSAVVLIEDIVRAVDFVCIGTNDLVQYLLAVDRDNDLVAEWYQTLHPSVIRSIRAVLRAADAADVPAAVCGEMAGSAFYTPLLIGLGAREFSMNLNSIAAVRNVIASISYEESAHLASLAEASTSSQQAEAVIKRFHQETWPHIYSGSNLDPNVNKKTAAGPEN